MLPRVNEPSAETHAAPKSDQEKYQLNGNPDHSPIQKLKRNPLLFSKSNESLSSISSLSASSDAEDNNTHSLNSSFSSDSVDDNADTYRRSY